MLLTDAMGRCSTLSITSYDRLFPSQDTLPTGGFGYLIALPLQYEARASTATRCSSMSSSCYEDQWSYLQALPRIEPTRLQDLVAQAETNGRVLGVVGEWIDSEAPWRPARSLSSRLDTAALPGVLSATLAQRLYVRNEGLPAALLDAMRRLATFSNPLFLERQRLRISTARTPRVIACFRAAGRFLVLPRGSLALWVDDAVGEHG